MIQIKRKEECVGCNACMLKCPKSCISMKEDNQGFKYPVVDLQKCVKCGLCEMVCPVINQKDEKRPITVYAARYANNNILNLSSSGGIFYAIASRIIEEGGVVFGAAFDLEQNVRHTYADTVEDLYPLMRSKYVKSEIGDSYIKVREFIKEGKLVLFTGTSCQIAGLKSFLGKEYDLLYTIDIICHGVPSPMVWKGYFEEIIKPKIKTLGNTDNITSSSIEISFRDKSKSWNHYGFSVSLSGSDSNNNDSSIKLFEPARDNVYLQGFNKNLFLRPSCFACPAKSGKSGSDITLGDYWGIEHVHPDFYSPQGNSCTLVNTSKGEDLFGRIKVEKIHSDYNSVVKYNPSVECSSTKRQPAYDIFWEKYPVLKSQAIVHALKMTHPSMCNKVKSLIKRTLEKLNVI